MLRYFIAGFGNQKSAGITEIADGLDLVVFGHQRDRFSNQFVRLPDKKRGIALVSMDDLNVPDALFRMAKEAEDDADPEA